MAVSLNTTLNFGSGKSDMGKLAKALNKRVGEATFKINQRNSRLAAHYIQEQIAEAGGRIAPSFERVLNSLPLRVNQSKHSAFNVGFDDNYNMNYTMSLGTRTFAQSKVRNIAWGIVVTNYGRKKEKLKKKTKGWYAIGVKNAADASKKKGQPMVHKDDSSYYVRFVKGPIEGVKARYWIEEAIEGSRSEVKKILSNNSSYKATRTKSPTYGKTSKVEL